MGLQVRLQHALGQRLFDLPDRTVEMPLIVGRSREAEVKIPSVTVASQHCALFIHEGQWVLQDTSGGSTWVNSAAVTGPTPLCVGDVITLGSDATPATLEIDPAGVAEGRTGESVAAEATEPAPVAVSQSAAKRPVAKAAGPRPTPVGGYHSPRPAPPPVMPHAAAPSDDPWGNAGAEQSLEGWAQSAPAADATPIRRRKKQQSMSPVAMGVGILVCIGIVGATSIIVYNRTHPEAPPPVKVVPVVVPKPKSDNIFDIGTSPAAQAAPEKPVALASSVPPRQPVAREKPDSTDAPSTPTASTDSTPSAPDSTDTGKKDDAWSEAEGASFSPQIGQAILKFDDYRRNHPGAHTKELDGYIDDAMDRLWWQRIASLCAKRVAINKDIKAKLKDINDEPKPAFKKTLTDEKKVLETQLAKVQEHLTSDMGFTSDDTPNLDDKETMATLAAQRDASKFGDWKVHNLKFIRNNHGATPWDRE